MIGGSIFELFIQNQDFRLIYFYRLYTFSGYLCISGTIKYFQTIFLANKHKEQKQNKNNHKKTKKPFNYHWTPRWKKNPTWRKRWRDRVGRICTVRPGDAGRRRDSATWRRWRCRDAGASSRRRRRSSSTRRSAGRLDHWRQTRGLASATSTGGRRKDPSSLRSARNRKYECIYHQHNGPYISL